MSRTLLMNARWLLPLHFWSAAWLAVLVCGVLMREASAELAVDRGPQSYALTSGMLYLEDPSHLLAVGDVAGSYRSRMQPVPPRRGDLNFGYSSSAFWLALPLRVARDAPSRWLLEIGYSSLDRVEVFVPRGNGFDRQAAGDLMPFAERPYAHRNLVFPVVLEPGASQTLYLRIESGGNLTVPAVLWLPEALHRHDLASYSLLSIYYGLLLGLLLYNLLLYLSIRDPAYIAYVFFVGSMGIAMASLNGLGNQFLWPDFPAWGNVALPFGMSATGFFGTLFTRLFLDTRRQFPKLDRVLIVFAAVFALSAFCSLVLSYRVAAIFTSMSGLAFSAVAVAIGVYCHARGHPGARYFLIAWTLLLGGVASLALRNLGWLPTTVLTTHAMQMGSALEMLLLSFALADRINVLRREKDRARLELEQSEKRYRQLVELSPDAILIETEGRITFVNRACLHLLGAADSAGLVGRHVIDFIHASFREDFRGHMMRMLRDDRPVPSFTQQMLRAIGPPVDVEITGASFTDREARIVQLVMRDVTERIKIQRDLANSNAELESFALVASHDLQEPLRTVANSALLLQDLHGATLDADAKELLGFILSGVTHMRQLVDGLLALSQIDARPAELTLETDCNEVMKEVLANLRTSIEESGAGVECARLPVVRADGSHLGQVFTNLISNAIKFRGVQPPRIRVEARRKGPNWILSVADNGIGIAPAYFGKIFEIFERLHSRQQYAGTGVGLAICKKIVEGYNGRIWVESQPGEGTTFFFTVPAVD